MKNLKKEQIIKLRLEALPTNAYAFQPQNSLHFFIHRSAKNCEKQNDFRF